LICLCVEWLMPVQSGEITNILLLLQGQHKCVLVALAKTVSRFTYNCTHIHPAPAHRVSYLHSLVLPCEAGTNFTYIIYHGSLFDLGGVRMERSGLIGWIGQPSKT